MLGIAGGNVGSTGVRAVGVIGSGGVSLFGALVVIVFGVIGLDVLALGAVRLSLPAGGGIFVVFGFDVDLFAFGLYAIFVVSCGGGVVMIKLYLLVLLLLLLSCAVDCGDGVVVFVGVIGLYVRALFLVSVVSAAGVVGGLYFLALASSSSSNGVGTRALSSSLSISCSPLTCLNDSR